VCLAVVSGDDGAVKNAGTVALGDRTRVRAISIEDGGVTLEVLSHGESDPMCCPSELRVWTYAVTGGELIRTGDELVGTVEPEEP